MSPAALMTVAIVIAEPALMRASVEAGAPVQATLWRGDWLEVRGSRREFVRVYDHRRERPGYIHRSLVRVYRLTPERAPALRAVMEFLHDRPGYESLQIGLAALYIKAAPASALDGALLANLGAGADRLARRASSAQASRSTAAHLDVAASYGVRFVSTREGESTRICYDGAAYRQALALKSGHTAAARAALGLTDPRCAPRGLRPDQQRAHHAALLSFLARADPTRVAPYLGNRLRLRESRLASVHAFALARIGKLERARRLSRRALNAWLRVDKAQLTGRDRRDYERTALHVAASRWAREVTVPPRGATVAIALKSRGTGETCIRLHHSSRKSSAKPLIERCTYGVVWPGSLQISPRGRQLAVAVQHLSGWVEQWVFHRAAKGWSLIRLAPAVTEPGLGYVEVAGWTPGGGRLLLVREAMVEGKLQRRFQTLRGPALGVRRESRSMRRVRSFRRWASAAWKRGTVARR